MKLDPNAGVPPQAAAGRPFHERPVDICGVDFGTSNTVLAHEKDVPTKGGWALYADGSTKKLTADEFKKATLAKKK